jgi:hypothetical protein
MVAAAGKGPALAAKQGLSCHTHAHTRTPNTRTRNPRITP